MSVATCAGTSILLCIAELPRFVSLVTMMVVSRALGLQHVFGDTAANTEHIPHQFARKVRLWALKTWVGSQETP